MSDAPKLTLLAASPPDIIRGAQKDELYSSQVLEACHDMAQRVLGVFPALQYEREIKLLAQLLYHGLTTGSGLQTLGEEYCNMLQVTGCGNIPGRIRRTTLALLQSLGPYLAEKAMAQLEAENSARSNDEVEDLAMSTDEAEVQLPEAPKASHHRSEIAGTTHPHSTTPATPTERDTKRSNLSSSATSASRSASSSTSSRPADTSSLSVLYSRLRLLLQALQGRRWLRTRWGAALAAAARPLTTYGARLHLALFYVWGVYYQLPLRLLGVRFVSTARPLQPHTSYWTLGAVLGCHLALTAALHVRRAALEASGQLLESGSGNKVAGVLPHARLVDDREEEDLHNSFGTSATVHVQPRVPPSSRQCPLCLSARNYPTSTPCGHVFCWSCVAQWCGEKPECPLCRTRTVQSQLVPLYHSSLF